MPDECTDEELVREFRTSGDQECARMLFDRYKRRVYLACRHFFEDSAAAEDATQETFLRAFHNVDRYATGNFAGWLLRIAKNVCIDAWRRQRMHRTSNLEELNDVGDGRSMEDSATQRAAVERVRMEMAKLPDQQRRCIELKIEGYSYEETAGLTGLSVAAVKSHVQNGRRTLWMRVRKELS